MDDLTPEKWSGTDSLTPEERRIIEQSYGYQRDKALHLRDKAYRDVRAALDETLGPRLTKALVFVAGLVGLASDVIRRRR